MYIPPYYRNENRDELISFMRAHPLAVICSNGEKIPLVTHLPFIIRESDSEIILVSHFAKVNPHVSALRENPEVLVIFSEPGAYISPAHYEKKENVPTWNYIAVHASGAILFLAAEAEKEKILRETFLAFDPAYEEHWNGLPPEYISGMMKGIAAFEITIKNLEGKFKLSQNKTASEQSRIANAPGMPSAISSYMKKNNAPENE